MTAFAVCGIYISFQAVVLAALRQRLKGWRPAGLWNLGRGRSAWSTSSRWPTALFAIVPADPPGRDTGPFLDRWIVAIGVAIVAGSGLLYLFLARPDRHSDGVPEGDARSRSPRQLQQIREAALPHRPRPSRRPP